MNMRRFYPGQEFLKYFKEKTIGMPEIWDQTYELFYEFTKGICSFYDIGAEKCGRFFIYMLQGRRARNLSLDEAERHYDCFKSLLKMAYEEEKLCEYTHTELVVYEILTDDKPFGI
jgi:hypothetical protein